jgi:hypothetical protein
VLETDPFGFVADTLAMRGGCTPAHCRAFALLNAPILPSIATIGTRQRGRQSRSRPEPCRSYALLQKTRESELAQASSQADRSGDPVAAAKCCDQNPPQGPVKLATILSEELRQLRALDRYEQRALWRRKAAIHAFDKLRRCVPAEPSRPRCHVLIVPFFVPLA